MEFTKMSSFDSENNGVKLLDAAAEGRADDAVELLKKDPTLLYIADAMGDTALHVAARAGHGSTVLKMVEFLKVRHLENLQEVLREGNAHGDTPLDLASKNGHIEVFVQLAGARFTINIMQPVSTYPDMRMHLARMSDEDSIIAKELNKLNEAAKAGEEDVVMEILERNPSILERKDSHGGTVLHEAARSGNMRLLKKMFKFMQTNNSNLFRLLLEGNKDKRTPLHLALDHDSYDAKVARYLVEVAPRAIYKEDKEGKSPLKIAIERGYVDLVCSMTRTNLSQSVREHLLEYAKKVDIGRYALITRNLAIFQAIVEGLPELINVPDRKGWKLLSYVAHNGYFDEVKCILKHIQNSARKADEDGSFPIHKAVAAGHVNIVKELLLHCPEAIQDIDRKGRNLVELATLYKQDEVLSYLKEKVKQAKKK